MNDRLRLETDILKAYFNQTEYEDEKYSISIILRSGYEDYGFTVRMRIKEPHFEGAFPQGEVALEQHGSCGHEGVHIQIKYHLIENEMSIGKLYIVLDAHSDEELLEIAEGFVYTLHEMFSNFGPDIKLIVPKIFKIELMDEIAGKKAVLIEKIRESLEKRMIEIRDLSGVPRFYRPEELRGLLESRMEFVPLLGPIIE